MESKQERQFLWRLKEVIIRKREYFFATLVVISWATAPIFFKIGVTSLTINTAVFWFLLFGGVFLTPIGVIFHQYKIRKIEAVKKKEGRVEDSEEEKKKRIKWWALIFCAIVAGLAQSLHYLKYIESIGSDKQLSFVIAVVKTSPLFQALFAVLAVVIFKWLDKEISQQKTQKTKKQITLFVIRVATAMLIGFIGVIIITTNLQFQSFRLEASVQAAFIAAVTWGFAMIVLKRSQQPYVLITGFSLLFATLFTLLYSCFLGQLIVFPKEIIEWFWLFYLGAVPTALAVSLWITALERVKDREYKIIIFDFFTPIIGVIGSVLVFYDQISEIFLIGLMVLILGVVLSTDELFER